MLMNRIMDMMRSNMKSTVWRFYAYNFLRQLGFFSAVLVPFFTEWGGITLFQVQLLQSWFMLWIFLLEVPTGAIADFFGRKYSIALGAFVTAVGALVYGSAPRFELFLLGEFLMAMGFALSSGADQALLFDTLVESGREQESKRIFAKAHTFTLLGIMASAGIGGVIAKYMGLAAPMLLFSIPCILAAFIALSWREPNVHQGVTEQRRYGEILKQGFLFFYRHGALRLLALDAIVVSAGGYFVIWLYQPLLQQIHIPIYYFGIGHMIFTTAEILIAASFIRMTKLFGSGKNYFRYTALLTAIPFFIVILFPNIVTIGLFVILSGGFGMTRLELMSASMNAHIPSEHRATVLSSISMFRRFSLVLLNPLVGFMASKSLFGALFFVGLLPLAIFLFSPVTEEALDGKKNSPR